MFESSTNSETCSDSTTASKSTTVDNQCFQGDVICDWLSFKHEYSPNEKIQPIESAKTIRIDKNGEILYEINDFEKITCPTSETSIRFKCDGRFFRFTGNIGRYGNNDNVSGLSVTECIDKALALLRLYYPNHITADFLRTKTIKGVGRVGFAITRIDLAANFQTDSYSQLSSLFASRKINRKFPIMGKYGPTWGYDAERSQYWNAKLYDKLAEIAGRKPASNDTLARLEIKLGSEYLRQKNLQTIDKWQGEDMENIIYGKFATPLLREQATAETWTDIPSRLRQHAILYRDGTDPKSYLKRAMYYRVKAQLLDYGLDISRPCNVLDLTRRIRTIQCEVQPSRRVA